MNLRSSGRMTTIRKIGNMAKNKFLMNLRSNGRMTTLQNREIKQFGGEYDGT